MLYIVYVVRGAARSTDGGLRKRLRAGKYKPVRSPVHRGSALKSPAQRARRAREWRSAVHRRRRLGRLARSSRTWSPAAATTPCTRIHTFAAACVQTVCRCTYPWFSLALPRFPFRFFSPRRAPTRTHRPGFRIRFHPFCTTTTTATSLPKGEKTPRSTQSRWRT